VTGVRNALQEPQTFGVLPQHLFSKDLSALTITVVKHHKSLMAEVFTCHWLH